MEGEKISEVREVKYLGYWITKNGGTERHIKERLSKAKKIMGVVWSEGERVFKENMKMRLMMYDNLVASVMLYGVEIFGWKEYKPIESIQERYIRWLLGLNRSVPEYIARSELNREKMRIKMGVLANKFEEKIRESNSAIMREVYKELEKARDPCTEWMKPIGVQYFDQALHLNVQL